MEETHIEVSEFLDMIRKYDINTYEHCLRVAELCGKIGDATHYTKVSELYLAAKVHDIGKILIPKEILCKNGRLTKLESLVVNVHAHWGYEMLSTSELSEIARQFVLYHHGFTNFPVYSQETFHTSTVTQCIDNHLLEGSLILQTCDIFDAVTNSRPYHPGGSVEDAVQALKDKHIPDRLIVALLDAIK